MACGFSPVKPSILASLCSQKPSPAIQDHLSCLSFGGGGARRSSDSSCFFPSRLWKNRRPLLEVVAIRCGRGGGGFGSTGSLNAPLEPTSFSGRSLCSVLQNDPNSFYDAVSRELNRLADDQDGAFARMDLSFGSSEASLHRRIAELKTEDCKAVVRDILYMMICYKFSEIKVPLVPSLEKCLYNDRLEILPSKDFELKAIHSTDVLEMVRGYLTSVIGWQAGSSVSVNWTLTQVEGLRLNQVYSTSIMYGYFLKSISIRHHLERHISKSYLDIIPLGSWTHLFGYGCCCLKSIALGEFSTILKSTTLSQVPLSVRKKDRQSNRKNLRGYAQGFDAEMLKSCTKMRSSEAANLVEKHCSALFGDRNSCLLQSDRVIVTSLASLKRLVMEAIAFGCFLWETEDYVDRLFKLSC